MRLHIKTKRDSHWIVHLILTAIIIIFSILAILNTEKTEQIITAQVVQTNKIVQSEIKEHTISMFNHKTNENQVLILDDYVVGVLSAEMPASYDIEALKAQAIAIRTLAYRSIGQKKACNGSDVCSESTHCQSYADVTKRISMWGDDFDKWQSKIDIAVYDTKDLIMTYNNQPIEVFYHASSNGMTENAQAVFAIARPYLVGVSSPDKNLNSDIKRYTYHSFASLLNKSISGLKLSDRKIEENIKIISKLQSGRVDTIRINDTVVTGVKFRKALGIQSTDFEISFYDNTVQIKTAGFGHGVGMSQKGANNMAKNSSTYDEILKHYYNGIEISNIN